jgi:hypothetical protein
VPTEPTTLTTPPSSPAEHRHIAPLRRLDREWLKRRAAKLDPRRHPSVSGAVAVAWLLRGIEPAQLAPARRIRLPHVLVTE